MKDLKKRPLFVYEMANNHMGDVEHGIRMIRELRQAVRWFSLQLLHQAAVSRSRQLRSSRLPGTIRPEVCEALLRNPS